MPGDDACIMSGLNFATSEIILGLRARDRGTFLYHGQGKLKIRNNTIIRLPFTNPRYNILSDHKTYILLEHKISTYLNF